MKAIIIPLLGLALALFLHHRWEPSVLLVAPAQAVTNPRGEARITKRLAPCETVDPAPLQMEDDA
jgi:hypothetical protein